MANASNLRLDGQTIQDLDDLVASGRFATPEDAVREGLRLVWESGEVDGPVDPDALDPATRQAVERGLADGEAGRTYPAGEVFDELIRELRAKP